MSAPLSLYLGRNCETTLSRRHGRMRRRGGRPGRGVLSLLILPLLILGVPASEECTDATMRAAQQCVADLNFPGEDASLSLCDYLEQAVACSGECCSDAKYERAVGPIISMGKKEGCENVRCENSSTRTAAASVMAGAAVLLCVSWLAE